MAAWRRVQQDVGARDGSTTTTATRLLLCLGTLWREAYVSAGDDPLIEVYSVFAAPAWIGAVRWPVYTSDERRSLFVLPRQQLERKPIVKHWAL